MKDIERIRRKRVLSGKDVGRVCIANLTYVLHRMENGEEILSIIPTDEYNEMVRRIKDNHEKFIYRRYVMLNDFLVRVRPLMVAVLNSCVIYTDELIHITERAYLSETLQDKIEPHYESDFFEIHIKHDEEIEKETIKNDNFSTAYLKLLNNYVSMYNIIRKEIGLESLIGSGRRAKELYEEIKSFRDQLEEDIYYLQGMNFIFDTIADYIELEETRDLKVNLNDLFQKIKTLSSLQQKLRCKVKSKKNTNYNLTNKKTKVLQELFSPIKTDYAVPLENKVKAKALIEDDLVAFAVNNGELEALVTNLDRSKYEQ